MAEHRTSKWTLALVVALLIAGAVYLFLMVTQSGLIPGDSPEGAVAGPIERSGQAMDLAALPWTAVVLIATAILGVALAYSQYRTSRITPAEEARTEAAVREQHRRGEEL